MIQLDNAFSNVEKRIKHSGWAIPKVALMSLCVMKPPPCKILEFGGGYSSIFFREIGYDVTTIEHVPSWSKKLESCGHTDVLLFKLKQFNSIEWKRLFSCDKSREFYYSSGKTLPPECNNKTRIKNTFYDIKDFTKIPDKPDIIILDGPNGNGRSLAWPLLKGHMKFPCYILIDDYTHYPFVEDFLLIFEGNQVESFQISNHFTTILVCRGEK